MKLKKLAAAVAVLTASVGANAAWDDGNDQDSTLGTQAEFLFVAWENTSGDAQSYWQDLGNVPVSTKEFIATPPASLSFNVDATKFSNFTSNDISWAVIGFVDGSGQAFLDPGGIQKTTLITTNGTANTTASANLLNFNDLLSQHINNGANDFGTNEAVFTTSAGDDMQTVFGSDAGGATGFDVTASMGEQISFWGIQSNQVIDFGGSWGFDGATVSYSAVPVPAAAWLFGSALLGLAGAARRRKA